TLVTTVIGRHPSIYNPLRSNCTILTFSTVSCYIAYAFQLYYTVHWKYLHKLGNMLA
ncbi:hypothetical protein RI129_002950, partial [Pyrocoelia pectoralis]